ncbi:MAG: hypothetical protein K6F72_00145 [Bacteroidales bacterium]|nr:hypothetical protein [Bacteroidales bacterium]
MEDQGVVDKAVCMNGGEISPETRLLLIELAEGFAEGMRRNVIRLSEGSALALARWGDRVMHPERHRMELPICNITQACEYLDISQPTFRKYIKMGLISEGTREGGYSNDVWLKKDIEAFANSDFFERKKRHK